MSVLTKPLPPFFTRSTLSILRKPLVTAVLVSMLLGCSDEKTDAEYLNMAKQAGADGDQQTQVVNLKNALQKNPENIEARIMLGKAQLASDNPVAALKELEYAHQNNADISQIATSITRAYYLTNQYDELLTFSQNLPELPPVISTEVNFYRGLSYIATQQAFEASEAFKNASQGEPSSVYAQLSYPYLYLLTADIKRAQEEIEPLLARHSDNVEVQVAASHIYAASGDIAQSSQAIEQAISLEPKRLPLYIYAAKLYLSEQNFEKASEKADTVLADAPNFIAALLIKAQTSLAQQQWAEANAYAEEVLARVKSNDQAMLASGIANFQLNNWEQSYKKLSAVKDKYPANHVMHKMLAFNSVILGYAGEGDSLITNMGELATDDSALLQDLGRGFAARGDTESAYQMLERASQLDAASPTALTRLGLLRIKNDDPQGLADLEAALERQPDYFWARAAIVDHYLNHQQQDKAIEVANELLTIAPEKLTSYLLVADAYVKARQAEQAHETFTLAKQKFPDTPVIYLGLATLEATQGNIQTAANLMTELLGQAPDNAKAWLRLYQYKKQLGQHNDALAQLAAQQKKSSSEQLLYLKALLEIDQKDPKAAIKNLSNIPTSAKSLYPNAQRTLGDLYLIEGNYTNAIKHFQNWKDTATNTPAPYLRLARVQHLKGDNQAALEQIQQATRQWPSSKQLHLILITFWMSTEQAEKANRAIEDYVGLFGEDAQSLYMRGLIAEEAKQLDQAVKHYRQSYEANPSREAVLALSRTLLHNQQSSDALSILEEWLSAYPDDVALRMYTGGIYQNRNMGKDLHAAKNHFEKVLTRVPDNFLAHNNLALIYAEQGQPDKALQHAKAAYEQQPNHAAVTHTYGKLLMQSGDLTAAGPLIESAYKQAPTNSTISQTYNEYQLKSGKSN